MTECEDSEVTVKQDTKIRDMYIKVMKMFLEVSF